MMERLTISGKDPLDRWENTILLIGEVNHSARKEAF